MPGVFTGSRILEVYWIDNQSLGTQVHDLRTRDTSVRKIGNLLGEWDRIQPVMKAIILDTFAMFFSLADPAVCLRASNSLFSCVCHQSLSSQQSQP